MRYDLHSVIITGAGGGTIAGISDVTTALNTSFFENNYDGASNVTFLTVNQQEPTYSFTTRHVGQLLGILTNGYASIPSTSPALTLAEFHWRERAAEGAFTATSTSIKQTINKGIIIPKTISASQGQEVTLDTDIHVLWDKTPDETPIVTSAVVAPTSSAMTQLYTLGPVYLNNVQLSGVQSYTIDYGIEVAKFYSDGVVWPTDAYVTKVNPSIRITTNDMACMNDARLTQTGAHYTGATAFKLFLTAKAKGLKNVANATASHISTGGYAAHVSVNQMSGSAGQAGTAEITLRPYYDGTNALLAWTVGVAIA